MLSSCLLKFILTFPTLLYIKKASMEDPDAAQISPKVQTNADRCGNYVEEAQWCVFGEDQYPHRDKPESLTFHTPSPNLGEMVSFLSLPREVIPNAFVMRCLFDCRFRLRSLGWPYRLCQVS